MTTLRTAAQQALEALEGFAYHGKAAGWPETITNLRAALAQQAEPVEPVAWADRIAFESAMNNGKGCDVWPNAGDYVARTGRAVIRLCTAPPPPPPQRKPLTEEEIDKIFKHLCNTVGASYKTMARAVERAHGIKE